MHTNGTCPQLFYGVLPHTIELSYLTSNFRAQQKSSDLGPYILHDFLTYVITLRFIEGNWNTCKLSNFLTSTFCIIFKAKLHVRCNVSPIGVGEGVLKIETCAGLPCPYPG